MSQGLAKFLVTMAAASSVLAPAAFAGVDPALMALVMPDAKVLVGMQVSQAQTSPVGQYLLSQVQIDPNTNRIMTAAGFDPRRDLRELLAASGDNLAGLVVGRGTFQPAKISKAAVQAGAVLSKYRGVDLLTIAETPRPAAKDNAKDKPVAGSFAFLDASTVAAGSAEAVKAAIDRHASGAVFSGQLAEKARQISVANDAWVATLTPPPALSNAAQGSQLGPIQNVLQSALQVSAGLKFAATHVTLSAEVLTRSAQDAQSMADLLKFFAGMLQAGRSQDPNAPKGPSLAEATQISSNGPVMHVVISVPEQLMEQFMVPGSKNPASGPGKKVALR